MHGPTFMGNPLACSVAVVSLQLLRDSEWEPNILRISSRLEDGLNPCRDFPAVEDVRVLGAIGVVEMKQPVDMAKIQDQFVDRDVWVRPFGKLVYVMPAYCMNDEDLDRLTGAICEVTGQ